MEVLFSFYTRFVFGRSPGNGVWKFCYNYFYGVPIMMSQMDNFDLLAKFSNKVR